MDFIAEQREKLGELLKRTVEKCIAAGLLKVEPVDEVYLEIPRSVEHGHLATNLALTLSKEAGLPPRQVAQILLEQLDYGDLPVAKGEVAGPGFINFHLDEAWWGKLLRGIIEKGAKYGQRDGEARRERIQLEFVSANPTGPMNVVNARAAAVGDSLARLLKAIGYQVEKEFYVNDAGAQANQFARSLEARYLQLQGQEAEVPADGYPGEYVRELAEELAREHPQLAEMDPEERLAFFQREGLDRMVQWQRSDLEAFGVVFDHWYREKTLHQAGKVEQVVKDLQAKGFVYEEDGALWFASTRFGDDKDRVVVRKEGMPTYLAADIAYHQDKFNRGFHKVIDIWGPDHHGYIARMKAAVQALGHGEEALEVIILQLVNLIRGGEQVRMSKRTGSFISMRELIDEVGTDAARFFFLMRSPDSHLDFDIDLAQQQTADNPVYYVQYAHARICSILRQVPELPSPETIDPGLLTTEHEINLMRHLAAFPAEVELAAEKREPHRIAHYAQEVAALFHSFYTHCRVIGEDQKLQDARLTLTRCVGIVLANALELLGVRAPESM